MNYCNLLVLNFDIGPYALCSSVSYMALVIVSKFSKIIWPFVHIYYIMNQTFCVYGLNFYCKIFYIMD